METTNPILGNPLLIAAILLFLAILPRALRQREKTALDKAVERFEKEEQKAASQENSGENEKKQKKPIALKDGSLAYLKEDLPAPMKTGDPGGIPPFPTQEEEKVKIVKPGIPISHIEAAEPPVKKKVKLIKQEFSIAPDPNKAPPKKDSSAPKKDTQSKPSTKDQKTSLSEDFPVPPPISDNQEHKDSWIEAEIPGLTVEPPVEEKTEDIPVFNASPKEEYKSEVPEPSSEEKQAKAVKNITPKTEEEKDLKPEKEVTIQTDTPELEMEVSESEPKEVEIKGSVPSHKSITKNDKVPLKTDTPNPNVEEAEVTETASEQEDAKASPEVAKLKPFLLDLRYLDQEESEEESPVSHGKLSAEMADAAIARLNALKFDLENQFASISDNLAPRDVPVDEHMRKNRTQDSLPELEGVSNRLPEKKAVSLEELDSFLFTAKQRKTKE